VVNQKRLGENFKTRRKANTFLGCPYPNRNIKVLVYSGFSKANAMVTGYFNLETPDKVGRERAVCAVEPYATWVLFYEIAKEVP